MTVITFPGKGKTPAPANAANANAPVDDCTDNTVTDLRIEHVAYPIIAENGNLQMCQVTNVMFVHRGQRKSSRYHYHLSQHEAQAKVERSLKRRVGK